MKAKIVVPSATQSEMTRMRAWMAGATVMLWAGCFHHPNVDVENLPCASDENCPTGST